MGINLKDMLGNLFQGRTKRGAARDDARNTQLLLMSGSLNGHGRSPRSNASSPPDHFLDEIDKIAVAESGGGARRAREGVQETSFHLRGHDRQHALGW